MVLAWLLHGSAVEEKTPEPYPATATKLLCNFMYYVKDHITLVAGSFGWSGAH